MDSPRIVPLEWVEGRMELSEEELMDRGEDLMDRIEEPEPPTCLRYTTAPRSFDGFGTRSIRVVGRERGLDMREVEIQRDCLDVQAGRYVAALYTVLRRMDLDVLRSVGAVTDIPVLTIHTGPRRGVR